MSNLPQPTNTVSVTDNSQQNVYGIAQGSDNHYSGSDFQIGVNKAARSILNDSEVTNLLIWLAEEQGISPEVALKKALVTAAYIHDVTTSQGGKLLVKRKNNTVGEIILK